MKSETLSLDTANGATSAYVAIPDGPTQKAVLVIQEYWGLNDHIKDIARRYADEGFIAIAPDLYRGKLAANPQEAGGHGACLCRSSVASASLAIRTRMDGAARMAAAAAAGLRRCRSGNRSRRL